MGVWLCSGYAAVSDVHRMSRCFRRAWGAVVSRGRGDVAIGNARGVIALGPWICGGTADGYYVCDLANM